LKRQAQTAWHGRQLINLASQPRK